MNAKAPNSITQSDKRPLKKNVPIWKKIRIFASCINTHIIDNRVALQLVTNTFQERKRIMNTRIAFIIILVGALLMGGCKNQPKVAETTTVLEVQAIQDLPQQMPAALFEGINDTLLAQLLPEGKAEAAINVFYLHNGDRHILFDAGMGAERGGQLIPNLEKLGVSPDDITDICITHLHADHIGGLVTPEGKAAFPHAVLHIAQAEYDAWTTGPLSSDNQQVKTMATLYEGHLDLFADTLALDGVHSINMPGHTPGHTMYSVGKIYIVGDLLHATALQVDHPEFSAVFDFDRDLAAKQRKQFLDEAREGHYLVGGMHFPTPEFIQF